MQSQYQSDRFRAWVAPSSRDAFTLFVLEEVAHYRAGALDAQELLLRYEGLYGSMTDAYSYRGCVEEVRSPITDHRRSPDRLICPCWCQIFDEYADEMKGVSMDGSARRLLLCLTAMVGKFGLTSREKEYVTDTRYTYSYYGVTTAGTKFSFKKPPKPRAWCRLLLSELDVREVMGMNLKEELGDRHGWLGTGLAEVRANDCGCCAT